MTRYFLACVGAAYLALSVWCTVRPSSTADSVGLSLKPGSGQSEYLVIYGGLELALGLFFLWPLRSPRVELDVLLSCAVLHGILVLYRTLGFCLFRNFQQTTLWLAATEWAIFLIAFGLWWGAKRTT